MCHIRLLVTNKRKNLEERNFTCRFLFLVIWATLIGEPKNMLELNCFFKETHRLFNGVADAYRW